MSSLYWPHTPHRVHSTKRSKASTMPPSSLLDTTTAAAALTWGTALPIATPVPTCFTISRSLLPSPTATICCGSMFRCCNKTCKPAHLLTPAGTTYAGRNSNKHQQGRTASKNGLRHDKGDADEPGATSAARSAHNTEILSYPSANVNMCCTCPGHLLVRVAIRVAPGSATLGYHSHACQNACTAQQSAVHSQRPVAYLQHVWYCLQHLCCLALQCCSPVWLQQAIHY